MLARRGFARAEAVGRAAGAVGGRLDEVGEGVVQEHGVAGGAVDDAVEDVGDDFALGGVVSCAGVE